MSPDRPRGIIGLSGVDLAPKRGKSVFKSKALKQYKLGSSDLEAIKPRWVGPNYMGPGITMRYNESDVQELAERIQEVCKTLQQDLGNGNYVPETDNMITTAFAKEKYNLESVQLQRLRQCKRGVYNVCDVEALVTAVQSLKHSSAPADMIRDANRPASSADPPVLERQVHGKKMIIYDLTQED